MSNYTEELIEKFKTEYNLKGEDFWDLKRGKKPVWIIKHNALERVAMQDKITWQLSVLSFAPDVVVKCVATKDEAKVESLGESSPKNTMNQYPYAMAEKRAVDRCILKLLNAHAYLYSESEADDFKEPVGNSVKTDAHDKLNKIGDRINVSK